MRTAFGWVHRAAAILRNRRGLDGDGVRRRLRGLLGAIARHRKSAGRLSGAIGHLLKVTRGYWRGLFASYDEADLPRTNNDLEQFFGSCRHHERRCSGRKVASPGLVVRGSVRIVAAAATRLGTITAAALAPADLKSWQSLRGKLADRQEARAMGRRFRRDPGVYLGSLGQYLIKGLVPS